MMIQKIILELLLPAILCVSGCSETMYSMGQPQSLTNSMRTNNWRIEWNEIKDDFEDVMQEMQIYSADGELLFTITDNEEVYIFIKNLELNKWDYSLKEIPPDALKLCTYISRLQHSGHMVTQAVNTVYYDRNGYYHLTETPDGGSTQIKMTDQAALYLINLAELELSGTDKFSDHEFYEFAGDDTANVVNVAKHYPPFCGLTYEGMLAASAENLIELYREGTVTQSISDNQKVYNFLLSLNTP